MASHQHYYVPAQSKWPIIATIGMFITVFGLGTWFNDMKAGHPESHGPLIFFVGALFLPTCCSAGLAQWSRRAGPGCTARNWTARSAGA